MKPTLIALTCVITLALSAPALAKAPPGGRYDCVIGSNSILFGTLAIAGGGKYTHRGTKGTFTTGAALVHFKDKRNGYTIRFKGGDLNGISGRWYPAHGAGVTYEIALKNPRDGFESIYCDN